MNLHPRTRSFLTSAFLCLLCALILIPGSAFAQITINKSHMPVPQYSARMSVGQLSLQVDPTVTGANHQWDFQFLQPQFQTVDTYITKFQAPLIYLLEFPFSVDVVRLVEVPVELPGNIELDEIYEYLESNNSGYYSHGFAANFNGIPTALQNDPEDRIFPLPLQYGAQDVSVSHAEVNAIIVALYRDQTRETEVDGWGTLSTPYGTFNVMRVKSTLTGQDSISYDGINLAIPRGTTREYRWIAQEERVPILQINTQVLDGNIELVQNILYVDSLRSVPGVSINSDLNIRTVSIYPNPATTQIQVKGLKPQLRYDLALVSASGQLLRQMGYRAGEQLDIADLPPGIYLLRLQAEGEFLIGKFIVE